MPADHSLLSCREPFGLDAPEILRPMHELFRRELGEILAAHAEQAAVFGPKLIGELAELGVLEVRSPNAR